ncbi:beta-lactamase family protein [Streptomyces sp. XM4193]|uniref:serine hydrolase domain-containing protein n=1 Tax=Streptomyces sp. XM4193 TaxID=2929782 RepID=UPI001FF6FE9A|nr:serine hydrolase domain-containing protein [Streptomyces sp. XM4193]MCK1796263.1 beta-lactamase family protein [Streptomyces sp. XM4193]
MTNTRMRRLGSAAALAAIVVTTATTGAAHAENGAARDASAGASKVLRKEARRALEQGEFVSITAGLRDGRKHSETNQGLRDLDGDAAPPSGASYRIASTTKTFTSTVVLQLVGEGRLSLEDTVEEWLPGLVRGNGNDGSAITVRNLLQNTSGLHNYTAQLPLGDAESFERDRWKQWTPRELVGLAVAQKPSFPPAAKDDPEPDWEYSNTNFVLAGMIIEAVTGNDWRTEVTDRIIRPLGLKDTYAPGRDTGIRGPHSRSYQRFADSGEWTDTTEYSVTWGDSAGELISTHRDLDRFFTALLRGKLLAPAELRAMRTTVPMPEEFTEIWPGARYGLGLMSHPLSCGGKFWAHHGDLVGNTVRLAFTDDGRVGVASTANGISDATLVAGDRAIMRMLDRTVCEARD